MSTYAAGSGFASQTAYNELIRIQRRRDPEQGRWKDYYRAVIDCLRLFVEQQYGVQTANRSVVEMRRALHRSAMTPVQVQSLLDLLAENETIQKATFLPGLGQGRQLIGRARAFIAQTALPSAE